MTPDPTQETFSGELMDTQWVSQRTFNHVDLPPGEVIGKCRIIRELGSGAIGTVYLAQHMTLEVEVAIKILPPLLARDTPQIAQRFIREAVTAAQIRHPNVVSVMDADTDPATGLYYIVFEYLSGGTLKEKLQKEQLSESMAVAIIEDVAEALVVAEEHGVVHRDVKPDNIMLDARGKAKLADLGLAKVQALDGARATQNGVSVGTPAYMSPDQVRDASAADAQDDLYSLGATFFECLTGHPPYVKTNPYNVVAEILSAPVPDPRTERPEITRGVAEVCQKLLAKEKKDRYLHASEVVDDLRRIQTLGYRAKAVATDFIPKKDGRGDQRRAAWVVLLAGALVAYSVWPEQDPPASPVPVASPTVETGRQPPSMEALDPVPGPQPDPIVLEPAQTPDAAVEPEIRPALPVGIEEPTPAAPALTLFRARSIAEKAVGETVAKNLLLAMGPRRLDSVEPAYWRFLFWDAAARQNVRAVIVAGETVTKVDEGFVELGKLRIISYKKEEIITGDRLQVDSDQALVLARRTPELVNVPLSGVAYVLEKGKGHLPPVWVLTLFIQHKEDVEELGSVRVSAETGQVYDMRINFKLITQ
jgi:hypothetical protein